MTMTGIVTLMLPLPAVKLSGTKCWFMSIWWVSVPSDTRLTAAIDAASGVDTEMVEPYVVDDGAEVIVGRGPLNRYDGE